MRWLALVVAVGFLLVSTGCGPAVCGDGFCEIGENATSCPADCLDPCGDGVCDAGEDAISCPADCAASACAMVDLTGPAMQSTPYTFTATDCDTATAAADLGSTVTDFENTMSLAKPANGPYEFETWGCVWLIANVTNPGSSIVRGTGTRDYMMICEDPSGTTLFGSDDFDTADCVNNGNCDPGLDLMGAGAWTCAFTVSPFNTVVYPDNSAVGGTITVSTD